MTPHPLQQWFPQFSRVLERAPMAGLMCAGAILLGIALAGARTSPTRETGAPAPAGHPDAPLPLFDGAELHQEPGVFQTAGERLTFVPAEKKIRFTVLENRVLQQVTRSLADNPLSQPWIVSGTVTTYRENYYLLMTRAARKTQFPPETAP
jgi:hypothetical protein